MGIKDDIVSIEYEIKKKSNYNLVNNDTGEVLSASVYVAESNVKTKTIDKGKFLKVFYGETYRFKDLTVNGYRVFWWVIEELEPNKSAVYLLWRDFVKATDYKKHSFYAGIESLVKSGILIATPENHVYDINVEVAFNGSRVKYVSKMPK